MTDEERAIALLGIGLNSQLRGLADGNLDAQSKLHLKPIDPNVVQKNFHEVVAEKRELPILPMEQTPNATLEADLDHKGTKDLLAFDLGSSSKSIASSFSQTDVSSICNSLSSVAKSLESLVDYFTVNQKNNINEG